MPCKPSLVHVAGACLVVFVYFVLFPEDVAAITAPIAGLTTLVATVLNLSYAVSPWLYGLLAVGLVARAITQTWGAKRMSG